MCKLNTDTPVYAPPVESNVIKQIGAGGERHQDKSTPVTSHVAHSVYCDSPEALCPRSVRWTAALTMPPPEGCGALRKHQLRHDFRDHPHHHQAACHSTNWLVTSQTTHRRATPPAAAPAGRPLSAAPPAAHSFAVSQPAPLSGPISAYSQHNNTVHHVITVANQTQQHRENTLLSPLHMFHPLFSFLSRICTVETQQQDSL
ncbi:hypothetical protein E2C01_030466 [Portunus trituberculatus]|uniref:Uncharacterized protein n=1 Tax=Portunus trituberculatus TaxID=210409 RepID=A0A5B7EVT4_PORTR|nr:hypothetical protein [Portunus trituberculatus]